MRSSLQFAEPQTFSAEDRGRLEAATRLHGAGRLVEAKALYTDLLTAPGAEVGVLCFVLGLLESQRGEPAAALDWYDEALVHSHVTVNLLANRIDLLRAAGRRVEALAACEQALALRPDASTLHLTHGLLLADLGRAALAVEAYDRALGLDPANPGAHNNRGVALEGLGRSEAAAQAYIAALTLEPAYRHAHHNLGSVLIKLRQFDLAASSLDRALQLDPTIPEAWSLLGVALVEMERYGEALLALDQATTLRPTYAEAHNNRSVALRRLNRFAEAAEAAERAFALDCTLVEALGSRGLALTRLNRFEEALLDFNIAMAARPRVGAFVLNRGVAREGLADVTGAIEDFEAAEALDPTLPDAKLNRALALLRRGDYARGWPLYEHRWTNRFGPFLPYGRDRLWLGGKDLAGRTVLLWGEQGFGDAIQFCRFATDLAALGARVVVEVRPPLVRLMRRLLGPERVIAMGETPPDFDLYCPMMSLPLALGLPGPAAARRGAYLSADPADAAAWRARLGDRRGLRVGLAWTGNPGHENDHNRSLPLVALRPLMRAGQDLVSLQKQHSPQDLALLAEAGARAHGDDLGDFADTAALIAACDAVVAVDTSVAHLAAAMGKPTLILLPRFADWRWGDTGCETPWYPRATLMRQATHSNWSGPVDQAFRMLSIMAQAGREPG